MVVKKQVKLYRELLKQNHKKTNNSMKKKKRPKDLNRYLPREDIKRANRSKKRCSMSHISLRKCKLKQ